VAFVRTEVSEEDIDYIMKVEGIGELGTMLEITNNCTVSNYCLRCPYVADSFHLDDGSSKILYNFGCYKSQTASVPRKLFSSQSPP
jgi:hypothetical protein